MALLYAHLAVRCIVQSIFSLLPSYGVILLCCLVRTFAICGALSKLDVLVENIGMHATSMCSKAIADSEDEATLFEQVTKIL